VLWGVLIAIAGAILWVGTGLALFVPRLRGFMRGPALFFDNRTPVGRGSIRAWWMRTLMLFALLSGAVMFVLPRMVGAYWGAACLAVATLAAVVQFTLTFFNWPKFLCPPTMRDQPGAIHEWLHLKRRRPSSGNRR